MIDNALHVCELFYSVQGESSFAGQPCVFVRLSGCNLRCSWCDTQYAFETAPLMSTQEIINKIKDFQCKLVEFTGGEPMLQNKVLCPLMQKLIDDGFEILLETNGALPLDDVPLNVHRIIDLKPPQSGTNHNENLWNHFAQSWRPTDEIKCVVCDKNDFDWCIQKLHLYNAIGNVIVHFSPVWGKIDFKDLADWVCRAHLPIRLNMQIHKFIWDPDARGV